MTDTPSAADGPSGDAPDSDSDPDPPSSALDSERYAHLSLDGGGVVIYDRRDPETWLQSDFAVEVGG